MKTQEVRLLCHITLEVPVEKSLEELIDLFNGSPVRIARTSSTGGEYSSYLDIIDIEEESKLYETED